VTPSCLFLAFRRIRYGGRCRGSVYTRATLLNERATLGSWRLRWQFADSSHFTRAFKDRYAVTPAEYAHANQPDRDSRSKNARP
jgi:methylphosphotriester-DNA--protein-cysteine methyltransferase